MNTRKMFTGVFSAILLFGGIPFASARKLANHAPCPECNFGPASNVPLRHNSYIYQFVPSDIKGTAVNQFVGCNESGQLLNDKKLPGTCADYTSASTHSTWRIRYVAAGRQQGAAERIFKHSGDSMTLVAQFDVSNGRVGQVIYPTGASQQYPAPGSRPNVRQQVINQIPFPQGRPGVGAFNIGNILENVLRNQQRNGQ